MASCYFPCESDSTLPENKEEPRWGVGSIRVCGRVCVAVSHNGPWALNAR